MTTTTAAESSKKKRKKLYDEEDDMVDNSSSGTIITIPSKCSVRKKKKAKGAESKEDKNSRCKALVPVSTTAIACTSKNGEIEERKEIIRQTYSSPVDDYNNIGSRAFSHIIHLKINCVDKPLSKAFFDVHKIIFATFNGSNGIELGFQINNSSTKISYYAPKSKTHASSVYMCNSTYRDDITYKHIEETIKYARDEILKLIHKEHKDKYTVDFIVCKMLRRRSTNINNSSHRMKH